MANTPETYLHQNSSSEGWVTINGAHILIGDDEGGGGGGGGGKSKGWASPHDEFKFVQKRLAAGGLKRGERRNLERRSERLAKQTLGVSEASKADPVVEPADCMRACQECIRSCLDTASTLGASGDFADCELLCRAAIGACIECMSSLSGNGDTAAKEQARAMCSRVCMDCVEKLEEVAQNDAADGAMKAMCENCSEACATCSEMCQMKMARPASESMSAEQYDEQFVQIAERYGVAMPAASK